MAKNTGSTRSVNSSSAGTSRTTGGGDVSPITPSSGQGVEALDVYANAKAKLAALRDRGDTMAESMLNALREGYNISSWEEENDIDSASNRRLEVMTAVEKYLKSSGTVTYDKPAGRAKINKINNSLSKKYGDDDFLNRVERGVAYATVTYKGYGDSHERTVNYDISKVANFNSHGILTPKLRISEEEKLAVSIAKEAYANGIRIKTIKMRQRYD